MNHITVQDVREWVNSARWIEFVPMLVAYDVAVILAHLWISKFTENPSNHIALVWFDAAFLISTVLLLDILASSVDSVIEQYRARTWVPKHVKQLIS